MAKILKLPLDTADRAAATTAPQDVLGEDAATFDVLRRMREDILCCVLTPDQRLRFGELRQRYATSVGTLREALSHLVSEGLARTEAGRGFSVAPVSLADFLDLSELRVYFETRTVADAIRHGTDEWEAEIVSSYFLLNKLAPPKTDDPVSVKREWGKRHKRFHDSLVATCRSPWSLHYRSELFDQARRYQLRDAVLARDVDAACDLVEKHIRTTVEQASSEVPGLTLGGGRPPRRRKS